MGITSSKAQNVVRCAVILLILLTENAMFCRASSWTLRNNEAFPSTRDPEYLILPSVTGRCGGTLVTSHRSEPKTLNPLVALDGSSKEIIGLVTADLIHINRFTQRTEPALASSWEVSQDGRRFTVRLRSGVRFSDGYPFDADDVLFTFRAYLDERIHSPQRDLLIVGGVPLRVSKSGPYTVIFTLAQPYAAAERLFDSVAILPRHLLEASYEQGTLAGAWNLNTPPAQIAGLGPFRFHQYSPGQGITLERNPFYWKRDAAGNRLPYLDRLVSVSSSTPESEEIRFEAGDMDIISRFDPQDFSTLERHAGDIFRVHDAGPGLEYSFLLFNLNDAEGGDRPLAEGQKVFRQAEFRRAVSYAIDRDAIVRLAYSGRARPLSVQISPGNRTWMDSEIPSPKRSAQRSKDILRTAHFSWTKDGFLKDPSGTNIEFSIMYNSAKPQQQRIAAILQEDLKEIGIQIEAVPMDFVALVDRVFHSFNYEAAIMTLADGDADPNTEMNVLLSKGPAHLWKLRSKGAPEPWQSQIDQLMAEQMTTLDHVRRKQIFDKVQEVIWEQQPVVFLVSPDILSGANNRVGNFQPAVLSSYTLWNADQLFIRAPHETGTH